MRKGSLLVLLAVCTLGACAGGVTQTETDVPEPTVEFITEPSSEPPPDIQVDASSEKPSELVQETIPEAVPESIPEPPPEHAEPVPEDPPQPKRCHADEACNMLLDAHGDCLGQCIKQVSTNTCRGQVQNGLCYRDLSSRTNQDETISDLLFKPVIVPIHTQQGNRAEFRISVTNLTAQAKSVTFSYQVRPQWQLVSASFKDLTRLDFKANETILLNMTMLALQADIFERGLAPGRMITFHVDGNPYVVTTTVGYGPDQDHVACGSYYFPKTYCSTPSSCTSNYHHYFQSVCCQGVFYPGAMCCTRSDCPEGGCFEGKCISTTPALLGNNLPFGHQKVLVVLSDVPGQTHDPSKVCTNRYNDLKGLLNLDAFEKYMDKVSQQYMGRRAAAYQWFVFTGIKTSDFNPTGQRDLESMHSALETYLISKGCIQGPHAFDKKYLIDPNVEIGSFGGKTGNGGLIVTKNVDLYLFIHELFHTYGADDLYTNLAGTFQLSYDLMANYLTETAELGVTRGEVQWGDTNADGVIDIFEYAEYPDAIMVTKASALLSSKNTLEVMASIAATEKGVPKKILIHFIQIELPEYQAKKEARPGNVLVFDSKEVDLDAIRKKGTVKMRVHASYFYTDRNFVRKELKLAEDKEVFLPSK